MTDENGQSLASKIEQLRKHLASLTIPKPLPDSAPASKNSGFGWKEERPNTWVEDEMLRLAHLAAPELSARVDLALKDLDEWVQEASSVTTEANATVARLCSFSNRVQALAGGSLQQVDRLVSHVADLADAVNDIDYAFEQFGDRLAAIRSSIRDDSFSVMGMDKREFDQMVGLNEPKEPTVYGVPVSKIGTHNGPAPELFSVLAGLKNPTTEEVIPPVEEPILQELVFSRIPEGTTAVAPPMEQYAERVAYCKEVGKTTREGTPLSDFVKGEVLTSGNGTNYGGEGVFLHSNVAFTPVLSGIQIREVDRDGNVFQVATEVGDGNFIFDPPGPNTGGKIYLDSGVLLEFRFANPPELGHFVKAFYAFQPRE